MMCDMEAKVRELLQNVVAREGIDLIHVECLQMQSRWLVRLFLDKDGGITVDDCAFISGIAGDIMDVHDLPPGAYTLEVSSPGIERPVSRVGDFELYAGRNIAIKLKVKLAGKKNMLGRLVGVSADKQAVMIETTEDSYTIPMENIAKANLTE